MTSAVPPGRGLSASLPRHFVPGYYQPVPPGQKAIRPLKGPSIKLNPGICLASCLRPDGPRKLSPGFTRVYPGKADAKLLFIEGPQSLNFVLMRIILANGRLYFCLLISQKRSCRIRSGIKPQRPGPEARSERVQLKPLASCGDPTRTSLRYPCRSRRNLLARHRA
jgi:hypothetical protein